MRTILLAAGRSGLLDPSRRELLLSDLPAALRARLPRHASPHDQALSDLTVLDDVGVPAGGYLPLITRWLLAASAMCHDPGDRAVFLKHYADLVEAGREHAEQRVAEGPLVEPSLLRAGQMFDARFELLDCLSESLFSVVWRAHDTRAGQDVALKIHKHRLDLRSRERLARGARHLYRMSHPNLVRVFDFRPPDDQRMPFYYWMEYLCGGDLQDAVSARRLETRAALDAVLGAAEGLLASHEAGVWHRDVKPDNILLGADGRARLADFDLLRTAETADESSGGRGSIIFAAPEALADGEAADHRADIFGLGRTAQFILFADARADLSAKALRHAWARAAVRNLDAVLRCASELEHVLRRATALDPDQRYATVGDFIREMREALDDRSARLGRRFVVGEAIGRTTHGTRHRAHDTHRPPSSGEAASVVVELYDEDGSRRIDAAFPDGTWSDLALGVCHPHVVVIRARGRNADGRYWQAVDAADDARPFDAVVDAAARGAEPLTAHAEVLALLAATCRALAYCHAHGIVHRDLRSDSLRVVGDVPLIDGWILAAPRDERRPECSAAVDLIAVGPLIERVARALAEGPPAALAGGADVRAATRAALGRSADELRALQARIAAGGFALMDDLARALDACVGAMRGRRQLAEAEGRRALARSRREDAERLRRAAADLRRSVRPWAPAQVKHAIWDREDTAARLEREADDLEGRWLVALERLADAVPEATERLIDALLERLTDAERRDDRGTAARVEQQLRVHVDRPRVAVALDGPRTLRLRWREPDTRITLARLTLERRRIVPEQPIACPGDREAEQRVGRGDYLVVASRPDGREAVWPLRVGREAGDGPILLELDERPLATLEADAVYVPAGPCIVGGRDDAVDALPRQVVHVAAFVIGRLPVTHADFLAFLAALVRTGRADEAIRHLPRAVATTPGRPGAPLYTRTPAGHFELPASGEIEPLHPIGGITWFAAQAYARYHAARTGRPWRLPRELEIEKAARGADGRACPWGPWVDEAFGNVVNSLEGTAGPIPVDRYRAEFPADISPYGVAGLGGNMRCWCLDPWRYGGPFVDPLGTQPSEIDGEPPTNDTLMVIRGAAWSTPRLHQRSANRYADPAGRYPTTAGIRLVRPV